MPALYNKQTNTHLGDVSDADVQFLIDHLEEESRTDDDYFIDDATVDVLEGQGAAPSLVEILRAAVTGTEGFDIQYRR